MRGVQHGVYMRGSAPLFFRNNLYTALMERRLLISGMLGEKMAIQNGGSGSILTAKRNILDSLANANSTKRARYRKNILCVVRSMCRWDVC